MYLMLHLYMPETCDCFEFTQYTKNILKILCQLNVVLCQLYTCCTSVQNSLWFLPCILRVWFVQWAWWLRVGVRVTLCVHKTGRRSAPSAASTDRKPSTTSAHFARTHSATKEVNTKLMTHIVCHLLDSKSLRGSKWQRCKSVRSEKADCCAWSYPVNLLLCSDSEQCAYLPV